MTIIARTSARATNDATSMGKPPPLVSRGASAFYAWNAGRNGSVRPDERIPSEAENVTKRFRPKQLLAGSGFRIPDKILSYGSMAFAGKNAESAVYSI
jgi:hypothetical protein